MGDMRYYASIPTRPSKLFPEYGVDITTETDDRGFKDAWES